MEEVLLCKLKTSTKVMITNLVERQPSLETKLYKQETAATYTQYMERQFIQEGLRHSHGGAPEKVFKDAVLEGQKVHTLRQEQLNQAFKALDQQQSLSRQRRFKF